jgi:hypothetical protein
MALDFGLVEFRWRMRGGYNMIRYFMGGLGEESSNLPSAVVELTIRLTFVIEFLVIFKVCALFGTLRW